ncbi:MAG: ABC transporter permease [Candidatus Aminicenantales bacterium]
MSDRRDVFARKGLLSLLVDSEMASTIREDLEYQRSTDRKEKGPLIAALRHAVRLAATIGSLIVYAFIGGCIMIGNSMRMARRNLAKHKGYSFINIAGLALGMAACLFLVLWVQDELSFDAFHKNVADIFRVDVGWV